LVTTEKSNRGKEMNQFNTPAYFVVRWGFVALFVVGILTSLRAGHHLGVHQWPGLVALSLIAAAAVWVQDRHNWMWIKAAFLVLSIGLLRLVLEFNETSWYGLAIWAVAALLWRHWHGLTGRATLLAPGARSPSAAQPSRQSPTEPPAPVYTFDQNVRTARYRFGDLVGMANTKKRLHAAGQAILAGDGATRNGILLFGEPGNGKTMFAEALAGELDVPFFTLTYGDVASKWINETPQKVDAAFKQAHRLGRCVLFIDEFDSFVKPRDAGLHAMDRDLANVMLTNINDLHGTQVVLVAATNFIDSLDGAAIRDGRFDYRIEVPPPDFQARKSILRKSIGEAMGYGMVDSRLVTSLAERWDGFSASRLASLGGPLAEMGREGIINVGRITFDHGMRAMRLLQGRRGKLPEDVKAIDEIIMPAASRDALRDLAFRMRRVHQLEQRGGRLPSGLIFFGPPGTGKTQAAMALAKASEYAFLRTTGATIMGNPGSWDKLVREAKDIRPVIVFIDEADDILADRRYSHVASLTNKILTTLDGADGRVRDVIYIAATNHYDRLDSAALRGGRFEEKIRFDVPDHDDMERYVIGKLKQVSEGQYALNDGVVEKSLSVLSGRSIADADAVIARAINFAAVRALQENVIELRPADVIAAARAVLVDGTNSTA
jgi:transitional endoplasmic reticulum ATPase